MEEPGVGAIVSAPAEVSVPGVFDVTALATAAAAEGDRTGFLVLERDGERRRLPWWLGITRSRLDEAPARHLRRPGIYHADASTGGSRVTAYRYPDAPVLVRTRLPGPEQVFRFVLGRPVANFGVAVTRSGRGVVVEPRIVAGADENRLLGVTALPYVSNPYLPTLYAPTRSAAALLPSPGAYSIVFDTPGAGRAGPFTFRFWIDDVTPPSVRLISARATAGRILARVGDRGAGVDPAAIFYTVDGSSLRQARYDAQRGIAVIPVGFAGEGTHRLVLRVSDRQEAKNTENVPLILPNTRVVRATIRVP
jgi:hypothetical protein